jgi:lipopolysaccharide/colanic/teichoic acid biosynthesis glycosyltransferase
MSEAMARQTRFVDPQGVQRRLKVADFFVLLIATMAVFLGSSLLIPAHSTTVIGFLVLEVALGSVLMMNWIGLYGLDALLDPRRAATGALATAGGLGTVVFLCTHLGVVALEPSWLAGWALVCAAHFTLTRTAAWLWAKPRAAAGAFRQRVAVVGWGGEAEETMRLLETADPARLEVVCLFDDRCGKAGAMADLTEAAREGWLDLIVIAIPASAEERLLQLLKKLWPLPVEIRISGLASQLKLDPRAYTYLGKLPLLAVFDRPLKRRRRAKDLLDRTVAALLLLGLTPVLVLAALALRLTGRGPVLVREQRPGFDGTAITVCRFDCTEAPLVGGALHQLGLDGVLQLVNVLKGELSLVGPRLRPADGHAAGLYQQVIDGYFARHDIKPGITGWAQINDFHVAEKTAKHDLEYVDRWSLLFDLYILFKAPFALLRRAPAR